MVYISIPAILSRFDAFFSEPFLIFIYLVYILLLINLLMGYTIVPYLDCNIQKTAGLYSLAHIRL